MKRTVLGSQEFLGPGGVLVADGWDVGEEVANMLSGETVCPVLHDVSS